MKVKKGSVMWKLLIASLYILGSGAAISSEASKLDQPILGEPFTRFFQARPMVRVDVTVEDATGKGIKALDFFLVNLAKGEKIPSTLREILDLAHSKKTEEQATSFLAMNMEELFKIGSDVLKVTESLSEPGKAERVSSFIALHRSEFS